MTLVSQQAYYAQFLRTNSVTIHRNFKYVPGHCFFDAAASSLSQLTQFRDSQIDARMVRKIIGLGFSEAAKNPEIRRIILNVLTDALVHSIPNRDPSSSVKWSDDRNQLEYLLRRADMHCDIDCGVATGSLWEYVQRPDAQALAFICGLLGVAVFQLSKVVDTDKVTLQKLSLCLRRKDGTSLPSSVIKMPA